MADEPSGVAGSLGQQEETSFYARAYAMLGRGASRVKTGFSTAAGFGSSKASTTGFASNMEKLEGAIDKLISSGGGIERLETALQGLATRIEGIGGGGGTGTGSGAGPAQHGTVNPHAGFGGINKTEVGIAAATYGLYKTGQAYASRYARAYEMAPATTQLQGIGNLSYGQVNQTLANRTLTYGTTGPMDTLAGAQAAQYLTGTPLGSARTTAAQKNISEIAMTNPGMGLEQAGQLYTQLRSPAVANQMYGRFGPGSTFVGRGGGSPDYVTQATALVRSILNRATPSQLRDPQFIAKAFTPGSAPQSTLARFVGGDQAAQSILQAAVGQTNYTRAGGTGTLFQGIDVRNPKDAKEWERQAGMAGYGNRVIAGMRESASLESKNADLFNQTQERNIATSTAYQRDIRNFTEKIARGFGFLGPGAVAGSGLVGGLMSNPLISALLGAVIGKGGLGALAGGGGAAATGGAAEAAPAAAVAGAGGVSAMTGAGIPVAAAVGGYAAHQWGKHAEKSSNPWLSKLGTGVKWVTSGPKDVAHQVAYNANVLWNAIPGVGDPDVGDPATDLLSSRNMSGSGGSAVTGLKSNFAHALARMFKDNPALVLNSGYRSVANQAGLWAQALKKYGSAAEARKHVAPPGNSMHQQGLAADIGPSGQYGWLKANAGRYGLVNYAPEPWHWELAGASQAGNRTNYGVGAGEASGGGAKNAAASTTSTASTRSSVGGSPGSSGGGGGPIGTLADRMMAAFGPGTLAGAVGFFAGGARHPTAAAAAAAGTDAAAGGGGGGAGKAGKPLAASKNMQDFIDLILPYAKAESRRTGIPASVFLAQSGVETGWGTSGWWKNQKNPAGIGVTGAAGAGSGFPSIAAAFKDYANKLMGHGEYGQDAFVADVRRGASSLQLLKDIEASPWAAGHYGGHGLEQVYSQFGLGKYDVGDPETTGSGRSHGGTSAMIMSARPMSAQFVVNVQSASQAEAERFAQYAWQRLQQLDAQEKSRSV